MQHETFLNQVRQEIAASGAWWNPVFEKASRGAWTPEEVSRLGPEYYEFTHAFPSILSKLIARVHDLDLMVFLVDILHSELGKGSADRAHARLFANLLSSAGLSEKVVSQGARLDSTRNFLRDLKGVYGKSHLLTAIGAQYALEFQADNMLRMLGRGFAKMNLPYSSLEFFRIHETDEEDHIKCMTIVINRLLDSRADQGRLQEGARICSNLFASFWQGIASNLHIETVKSA